MPAPRVLAAAAVGAALVLAACGGDDATEATGDRPVVAVTTNILGDVVSNIVGDQVDVVVLMPVGVDPHEFQLSARQVAEVGGAAALVVNGGGFEAGIDDAVDGLEADGVPVIDALSTVDSLPFAGEHADDDHGDDHGDDDHGDDDHDHGDADPHFFTDPDRMATAVRAIADQLVDHVDGVDANALVESAAAYAADLEALAAEVADILAPVAAADRVLVTNHDVFGYFAAAYGFDVVGTVIPGGSTAAAASAGDLSALVATIERERVPAVFTDASAVGGLVDTLAEEAGGVDVVALFTESLGDASSGGGTYVDMVRTNAERIAAALG